jgi:hypothetical protein
VLLDPEPLDTAAVLEEAEAAAALPVALPVALEDPVVVVAEWVPLDDEVVVACVFVSVVVPSETRALAVNGVVVLV